MTQKTGTPLIAKLQTAPDAAWGPMLDQIDDARAAYDPATQTGTHPIVTGECNTYFATSSGGSPALSAEPDGNSKELPIPSPSGPAPQVRASYRTMSSGGSARFPDDGSKH